MNDKPSDAAAEGSDPSTGSRGPNLDGHAGRGCTSEQLRAAALVKEHFFNAVGKHLAKSAVER